MKKSFHHNIFTQVQSDGMDMPNVLMISGPSSDGNIFDPNTHKPGQSGNCFEDQDVFMLAKKLRPHVADRFRFPRQDTLPSAESLMDSRTNLQVLRDVISILSGVSGVRHAIRTSV